ncbi:MAG: hypothetical protein ACYDCO_01700 [Armatimonadota bacterium]
MQRATWPEVQGYLLKHGYARALDFLEQGPSGKVTIDYSRMSDGWEQIPAVVIDPKALE